jgi:predicted nucleic acid-binding protein
MLVVDAGPLVAAAATKDRNHESCVELLSNARGPIVVPELVVTEVAYFLADRLGSVAERAFVRAIRDGELLVEPVEPQDWERIDDLLERYEDLPLGTVDASVVAVCERLEQDVIATLDRRHFGVVRPRHTKAFTLVPSA